MCGPFGLGARGCWARCAKGWTLRQGGWVLALVLVCVCACARCMLCTLMRQGGWVLALALVLLVRQGGPLRAGMHHRHMA